MRKLAYSIISLLMAVSGASAQGSYTITGTAEGTVDGDSVFLCSMQGFFAFVPEDTCVVKDGKFEFKGSVDGADVRFICPIHGKENKGSAMFILENAPINIQVREAEGKSVVKGGPNGDLYNEFEKGVEACYAGCDNLYAVANDSTKSEAERSAAQTKLDIADKASKKYTYDFIMSHIPSPVSDMLLTYTQLDSVQTAAIMKKMGESTPQYKNYKAIVAEQAANAATAIGQKYTDIALEGVDGKTVHVSDYVSKNKYTLIDFWASWCGPCRREMPNVVKAYDLYHSKGFEVVGVSLDNNKNAWVRALDQLHMPWPQMSDLKGWQSEGAKAYNIKAIPSNALVDQQGNIVAKDLREQELQDKLAELFK